MDPRTAALLLQLQSVDSEAENIRRELDGSELLAKLRERQQTLERINSEIEKIRKELSELHVAQREKELDVQALEEKEEEVRKQLYGGEVRAVRELTALQAELDEIAKAKDRAESQLLELMLEAESASNTLAIGESEQKDLEGEVARLGAEWARIEERLRGQLAALESRHEEIAAQLDPPTLELYERLQKMLEGVAVARLEGSKCSGCNLDISRAAFEEIEHNQAGIPRCEYCGRILVKAD